MVKVSVIMPVYNDQEFLNESIDSFLKQSLDDIELICVNDGSQDNSLNILKEYSDKYYFIKVFTKENEGPGIARNYGLQKATGEYIAYLDSDDIFIDKDALKLMYETAIKYDSNMVSANLKGLNNKGNLVVNKNLERFSETKIISPQEYGIPYSFYKNIFRRTFLLENNITFPDLLRGQDPVFLAEIFTLVDEIPTVPIDLYGFRYAKISGLLKINTHRKKYDYIVHFKDTFKILDDAGYTSMKKNYEKKLIYFIKAFHNSYSKEIKDIVFDVFKDDDYIKHLVEDYFVNPKISVIIPVYNAAEYLDESIPSVLNQSLKQIELLCVNDGSKDNSLEILEEFAKKDSRIRVIDKENSGCGATRNNALDEAIGDYIYFFDPDDKIPKNTLMDAYKNAINNDSDMVIFKARAFDDNGLQRMTFFELQKTLPEENFYKYTFDYHEVKRHVMGGGFAPWSKLYKKEFLDSYNDFRFDTGLAFDDVPFHVKSMLRARRISFLNKVLYYYRVDNANSVNSIASNGFDIFRIIDIVKEFLISDGYYDEFIHEFHHFEVDQILRYITSTDSRDYYGIARRRFMEIDEEYLPENREGYDMVIETEDFEEFKLKYYKLMLAKERDRLTEEINRLENQNNKLKKENKKLKKKQRDLNDLNDSLLNSRSWKITAPLRRIKKLR